MQDNETDEIIFNSLLADPNLLLNDGARIEWTGRDFEFESVKPGDFADELGFQSGGRLISVNSTSINSMKTAFEAFGDSYEDAAHTVAIIQGGTSVTHQHVTD